MSVRLNAAVRICPPSVVAGDHWTAENLLERRRYRLSKDAAAALVAACRPQDAGQLAERLAERAGGRRTAADWAALIETLHRRGLIVDADLVDTDARLKWLVELRRNWSRYGWHEAAEYHALSFDYPCLDYTEAVTAVAADQERMRGYQRREPDTDRFKLDYVDQPGVALPEPVADMSDGTARALWAGGRSGRPVDAESLAKVVSLGFGSTGFREPRTDSAPLLRRTSPSGGGRHPSEGYLVVRAVPGIEPGWYHVTMQPFSLRRLPGRAADDATLHRVFPETMPRFPFDIKALVVVTSVFERNMYRYREPRTFRTVHMDAGHIAGTLGMAARSLRLVAGIYYCDAATRIEQTLDIDGMREGYMLTVALADGVDVRATAEAGHVDG